MQDSANQSADGQDTASGPPPLAADANLKTETEPVTPKASDGAGGVCYVAGFMFNEAKNCVALIRKCKPEWQKGLLNGIGGKIEEGEEAVDAMTREFEEETGYNTHRSEWTHYLRMSGDSLKGPGWSVDFFAAVGNLDKLRTAEPAEPVEVQMLTSIDPLRGDMIENLPWLIPLALDSLADGRPCFVEARYP